MLSKQDVIQMALMLGSILIILAVFIGIDKFNIIFTGAW